jgi:hypothetical protein
MSSEAGAVIGVLFSILFVAILYWLYLRFTTSRRIEEEENYNEVKTTSVKKSVPFSGSARHMESKKSRVSNDISLLLFPEVINPMIDAEAGYDNGEKDEEDDLSESLENVFVEGISKSGYLRKKSTSLRKDWLVRWFFIKDGKLFYVHRHTELEGRRNINARQVVAQML